MATTREDLILRLRRLIDDVGFGYSQSAPGFDEDFSDNGLTTPDIGVFIDGDLAATNIVLSPLSSLTSGPAIAAAIQRGIRAAFPAVIGYANAICTFHRQEGYIIRSGSYGSNSMVAVVDGAVESVTALLKLGLQSGGYESPAQLDFSDEELGLMLDQALAVQNQTGEQTSWGYDTLPSGYETVVVYRSWSGVVDSRLGRSANFYPQKVASEETSANVVFDNYLRLAKWLNKALDDLIDGLGSAIECAATVRWDRELQMYVGDNAYANPANVARVNSLLAGPDAGSVILEFQQVLTLDCKHVFIAHSTTAGVWDPAALTVEDYVDPGPQRVSGLATGSVLDRTLGGMKNTMVRITGLTTGETYFFAVQVTDQNGNRYFSNELSVEAP